MSNLPKHVRNTVDRNLTDIALKSEKSIRILQAIAHDPGVDINIQNEACELLHKLHLAIDILNEIVEEVLTDPAPVQLRIPYIRKGEQVKIVCQGNTRQGEVISASNYSAIGSNQDCWYVELRDEYYGYVYWKQDSDGGTIEKL